MSIGRGARVSQEMGQSIGPSRQLSQVEWKRQRKNEKKETNKIKYQII